MIFFFVSCKQNEPETSSAYLSEVFDYVYAPGQHSKLANESDKNYIVGDPAESEGWLYLGGFGGYVVAGFDHDVTNGAGEDFEIFPLSGASPEPAVVYVMPDYNKDGYPNETWYELEGNQVDNSMRNYSVTYFKATTDSSNIKWKDSEGNSGELISGFGNSYSSKWWWPYSINDSITFTGTRLPDSYINNSTTDVPSWIVPENLFVWGYAENNSGTDYDSDAKANKLDISNAIDENGKAVNLSSIRFIKIQTGVFQQAGQLNEVSSEITGAKDLRL
ncbi:MAG: hypothetical protein PHS59_06355 [Paludibacter sp.]|nr:hypothetical protein [Paludibacter sp.]